MVKKLFLVLLITFVHFYCLGQKFIPMGTGIKCQGNIYKTFIDTMNNKFYAGGYFDAIENIDASGIAMWDGTQWTALGSGIEGAVFDIEIYNNELYVAGHFTSAGGAAAGNIAKWDGVQWLNVGNSGTAAQINEMEEFNGKLYISGPFQYIDGVAARYAAVFDGSTWSPLGAGFDYAPIDICKTSDKIYFSGLFNFFDSIPSFRLAWVDTSGTFGGLSSLAAASFSNVNSVNVRNDTLYLSTDKNLFWWNGTTFFNMIVGLKNVDRSFYYNDSTYIIYTDYPNKKIHVSKLHTGNILPPILTSDLEDPTQYFQLKFYSASVVDSGFFIGGNFARINGKSAAALLFYGNQKINHFGKAALPVYYSPDQYAEARTIFSDSSSGLYYVGGNFLFSDHLITPNISAWNGSNWLNVGEGLSGPVNSIIKYNGFIYAGGKFHSSGDTILNNLARWDGSSWRPVGNGTNGEVKKLLVHNNELYIGGNFTLIDTLPVAYCAKYDGTQFTFIGDSMPLLHPVYDMIFYKGRLHASLREHLLFKLIGKRWNNIGLVSSYAMGLAKTNDTLFIGTSGVIIYVTDSVNGTIITYNSTPNRISPLFINNRLFGTCDYFLLCRNNSSFDHYVYQFAAKASANISPTQSIVGGYFPYTISTFGKRYLNSIGILEFVPPAANIIASDDTICEYKVVTFYPESDDLFLRYNWTFSGGLPSTSVKEINYIQYFNAGVYPVSLTITNEVGSITINLSDSIIVNTCITGTASLENNESPSVFPNPFVDDIQIKSKLNGNIQYRVWDMYGKLVYSKIENNMDLVTINMEKFSQGIFILEISNEGFRHTQKIIKQ